MTNLPLLLIAVAAGIAVALQGQFMGAVNQSAGTITAIAATYGSGGLLAVLWWLVRRSGAAVVSAASLGYGVAAGILGLVIVGGIGYAAPRLGLSRTLVITVAAQLCAALVIEWLGLFGTIGRTADAGKLLGMVLVITGVWLVVR
jgi:transporter family-2 protein